MYTLVKSFVTNKDSTHSSSHALRTRTPSSHTLRTRSPHTLVKSYERGLHIHSSGHALRMHRRWPTSSPRQLDDACTADDLATVTERAKSCTRKWDEKDMTRRCLTNEDTLVKSCITNEDSTCICTRQVIHYERGLHHTLVKSCHYERGLHIHSSSHALRTLVNMHYEWTPYVYTRQVIHHERGLHCIHVKSVTNKDSTYTVKSWITNEDSTCIYSSSHTLRTRSPHTLVKSCHTNEDSTYTRQVRMHRRWPTSSPAVNWTMPVRLTWPQ